MSEEHTLSAAKQDHKGWSRHRWREKLSRGESSSATKDNGVRDQEIQSFLHGATTTHAAPSLPTLHLPVQTRTSVDSEHLLEIALPQHKRKQLRKPGLRVTFATTAPVIIGEGGDEALLPVIHLLSSLQLSGESHIVPLREANDEGSATFHPPVDLEAQKPEINSFRPPALERRSTGLKDHNEPAEVPQDDFELPQRPMDVPPIAVSPVSPPEHENGGEAWSPEWSLSAEKSNLIDEPRKTFAENQVCDREREGAVKYQTDPLRIRRHSLNPATSSANSLTPSPSPHTLIEDNVSDEKSYPFPAAAPVNEVVPLPTMSKTLEQVSRKQRPQMAPKGSSDSRGLSLRDVAKSLGEDAVRDFAMRVQPFGNLFHLGLNAQSIPTLGQWVMAASWWFLRGRSMLETAVRSNSRDGAVDERNTTRMTRQLKQAYVDLAKVWWIVSQMIPERCPEVRELEHEGPAPASAIIQRFVDAKNAELVQVHLSITSNLRALCISMKKNGRMPPYDLELQGLDARIPLTYQTLSPGVARLLSQSVESTAFFPIPITDTEGYFNYGRMFVDVVVDQMKVESQIRMACLLSILRHRKSRDITIVVASQDGQINVVIQPDVTQALSWQDARWDIQKRCIDLNLRADFGVHIQFAEGDFKTLWGIHDHTRAVQKASRSTKTESLVFEDILPSCHWFEQGNTAAQFPAGPVEGCTLRLFECFAILKESLSERQVHNGFRLVVVTPPKVKKLGCVSLTLGKQIPIVFSYLRDGQGASAMLLKTSRSSRDPYIVTAFHESAKRDKLFSLLSGTAMASDEHSSVTLSLGGFSVATDAGDPSTDLAGALGRFNARGLKVFCPRSHLTQHGGLNLRIWVEGDQGCFTDRVKLGPGELKLRLDAVSKNRICMSRLPQQDITLCSLDSSLSKEQYEQLRRLLSVMSESPSFRTFDFLSLNDLHTFQRLITGFTVLFDGSATSFAISRRRMVAIHKRWEASATRIQIVKHEQTVQLLAFFKDFSHGTCMNFVIKSTDRFESFSRSSVPYLCIADAKFALPRGEGAGADSDFVCLDMPEYPGEHDDISIGFENENGLHPKAKACFWKRRRN
ncbi:MAG: hypothetical protein Q9202_002122 [Teloschistes flavicans]